MHMTPWLFERYFSKSDQTWWPNFSSPSTQGVEIIGLLRDWGQQVLHEVWDWPGLENVTVSLKIKLKNLKIVKMGCKYFTFRTIVANQKGRVILAHCSTEQLIITLCIALKDLGYIYVTSVQRQEKAYVYMIMFNMGDRVDCPERDGSESWRSEGW